MQFPRLYIVSQLGRPLSVLCFFTWFWQSFYQASLIFTWDMYVNGDQSSFTIVTVSFTSIMLCEMLNIITCTNKKNWMMNFSLFLSVLAYFIAMMFFGKIFDLKMIDEWDALHIFEMTMAAWLPFQILS